jgi:transposase-like protein
MPTTVRTKVVPPARVAQLVARWRRSGESKAGFARRHGVHPRTFWGWCQAAAARDEGGEAGEATDTTFVPVTVLDADGEGEVDIVFPSGERAVVRPGASVALVRAVVTALRPPC